MAAEGTAESEIEDRPRRRLRPARDRCGATQGAWAACSPATPVGTQSDNPVPGCSGGMRSFPWLSFTWPARNRERSCSGWVEPLCSFTPTVNFCPGEIAASGSCPAGGCLSEPAVKPARPEAKDSAPDSARSEPATLFLADGSSHPAFVASVNLIFQTAKRFHRCQ